MTRPSPSEVEKLQSQLDGCRIMRVLGFCSACDAIRARLRLLSAPKLDLASLPESVPPEHQAGSFGALWPWQMGAGK